MCSPIVWLLLLLSCPLAPLSSQIFSGVGGDYVPEGKPKNQHRISTLVIMMADRGISGTHTTLLRWVQRYLPEFEKRWRLYARPIGGSWRMDETYLKVHGQWVYLYRAVD